MRSGIPIFLRRSVFIGFILSSGVLRAESATWSQFRGPNGSGVAADCRPPIKPDETHRVWKTPVPAGFSSPVLSKDRVFLTALEKGRLVTLAFDKETGKRLWRAEAPGEPTEKVHQASHQAASTPLVDDDRVIVYFGSFGLLCYDHAGKQLWQKPIPTPKSLYGMSTSPIGFGDHVILVLDNDRNLPDSKLSQSKMVALKKATGEVVWETGRPFNRSGWSTPILWKHAGGTEIVVLGNGRLDGYDATTGEEKWFTTGFSRETISVPVTGNGLVYGSSSKLGGSGEVKPDPEPFWASLLQFDENKDGKIQRSEMTGPFTFPLRPELPLGHPGYGIPLPKDEEKREARRDSMLTWIDKDQDGAWGREEFMSNMSVGRGKPLLMAVRPGGKGDVTETHVAWEVNRSVPEIPSPLFHDNLIYQVRKGGILSAIDTGTGEILYRTRLDAPGQYGASPVLANGHLYFVSNPGRITVVQAGREFRPIHQFELKETVDATPAIDEKTLYLRTEAHLLAFRRSAE
ncbi:MAG: PQQ-binding-like beta-propeller repeat protein [Verrucomicrobiota bacterium]